MLGAIYVGLASRADDTPISNQDLRALILEASDESGLPPPLIAQEILADLRRADLERRVNDETLAQLRWIAPLAFLVLIALALVIAYIVAGLVLAPVSRIVSRARVLALDGSDLGGRIDLGGPDDELRELADTLDELLDRTEGALASQRHFLADASHELRTPLAVAQTNLDVVLENPSATTKELRDATGVAREQIRRLGRMVGDLLALERGTGRRPAQVGLRGTSEQVLADLSGLASERGVSLTVEPGEEIAAIVDPDDLTRMITNLVENAVLHGGPEGEVRLRATRDGSDALLTVADDGPGVPAEHQERIFDRFHRANRAVAGNGLGLAIVRELATVAEGSVSLESGAASGATFHLRLPGARQTAAP